MRITFALTISLALGVLAAGPQAWVDNCDGSSRNIDPNQCAGTLAHIDLNSTWVDGSKVTGNHCLVTYQTDGYGVFPISGQLVRDTAGRIMSTCGKMHGSFATGSCPACHVTVNWAQDESAGVFDQGGRPNCYRDVKKTNDTAMLCVGFRGWSNYDYSWLLTPIGQPFREAKKGGRLLKRWVG
ncbi:MAG: hypothetical protein LQ346_008413 [Caloplaca aetnensis]|nr:MAG: hypothetical protein LQ346_008413 [Caloplaca aetnensis]